MNIELPPNEAEKYLRSWDRLVELRKQMQLPSSLRNQLNQVTVNEHGLMRQDCRCRVCKNWWRIR